MKNTEPTKPAPVFLPSFVSLLGRAPTSGRIRATLVTTTGSKAATPSQGTIRASAPPPVPAAAKPRQVATRQPRDVVAAARNFAHLLPTPRVDDDVPDQRIAHAIYNHQTESEAARIAWRNGAAAEVFRETRRANAPPGNSGIPRGNAVQGAAGIIKPPAPGSAAHRWLSVMKKLRGET